MKKTMTRIAIITAVGMLISSILYWKFEQDVFVTLAITLGTTCYHFVIRLFIGGVVVKVRKQPWNYNNVWFSPKPFEKGLYNKLKVKSWKDKMPTYNPESFDIQKHSIEEIVQTMCGSEIVHECILPFSFLPLFMAIPFGSFFVFLITSICGACVDLIFVIMQRYNRPRLVKILRKSRVAG